jgi:DNA (cytosine-5)-methyltransferase 1
MFTKIKGGFSRKRYPYPAVGVEVVSFMSQFVDGTVCRWDDGSLLAIDDFAAIHASPPCQHASAGTRAMRAHGDNRHKALIEPTRELLQQTGLPYVIENVKGAALLDPVTLCGRMFGLGALDTDGIWLVLDRHRMFESSVPLTVPEHPEHGDEWVGGSYGGARRDKYEAKYIRKGGYVPSKSVQQALLGIDWMTERGMYQALPPVYTQHIGQQLLAHIAAQEVAA